MVTRLLATLTLVTLVFGPAAAVAAQPPGKPAAFCGNGTIEKSEQCDQNELNGQTCASLGFDDGTLSCGANCRFELTQCIPAECGNGVLGPTEECEAGTPTVSCGDLGAGFGTVSCSPGCTFDRSQCSALRFVDNGDGTVTDFATRLMWEKKIEGSSNSFDDLRLGDCVHCIGDLYSWPTAMSEWISAVNGRVDLAGLTQSGFAGHSDWRLPTVRELSSILTEPCTSSPCIDPIFGPITTPSANFFFWSSTAMTDGFNAAAIDFREPFEGAAGKSNVFRVRAVRDAD